MCLGPAAHLGGAVLASGGDIWEEGCKLCSISENGRERDRVFETQQHENHQSPPAMEKQAVSMPTIKVSRTSGELEGWKLVTSCIKRKLLPHLRAG